jgi:hypothetical protein
MPRQLVREVLERYFGNGSGHLKHPVPNVACPRVGASLHPAAEAAPPEVPPPPPPHPVASNITTIAIKLIAFVILQAPLVKPSLNRCC